MHANVFTKYNVCLLVNKGILSRDTFITVYAVVLYILQMTHMTEIIYKHENTI